MLKHYQALLPQRITVKVERNEDDEGLWAQIVELPHCYTQAANATDLAGMITDAIQTHFEIPEEIRTDMGYYVPVPKEHLKMEEGITLLRLFTKISY